MRLVKDPHRKPEQSAHPAQHRKAAGAFATWLTAIAIAPLLSAAHLLDASQVLP